MPTGSKRRGSARVTVIAVLIFFAVLAGLVFPGMQAAREAARRNSCGCHGGQLGVALQNYHEVHRRFPTVDTQRWSNGPPRPGSTAPPVAGFSWLAQILPYQEEESLFRSLERASNGFAQDTPAMGPNIAGQNPIRHFATIHIEGGKGSGAYVCPSFSGNRYSELSGTVYSAANIPGLDLSARPPIGVAISTYVALAATDIDRIKQTNASENRANGVIAPNRGLNLRDIKDGSSKTLVLCETRERSLNAWLDGSVNWVVGANPNNSSAPSPDGDDYLRLPRGAFSSLNVGPTRAMPATRYLLKHLSPNSYEWSWGPSSEHSGGVVLHCYADGAARFIADDIDPTLYIQLITPAGREPVSGPDIMSN